MESTTRIRAVQPATTTRQGHECPDNTVYWLKTLGRRPDFDKWLRPRAYCPGCDEIVNAMQVFKRPGVDMGRYGKHGQYVYKCPRHSCRGQIVHPEVLPALTAIDWTLPGTRIGDRADLGMEPLAPDTVARVRAGLKKYAVPLLASTGGTWRDKATPLNVPMPTRTTRENDGIAVPPLMVPVEGRDGKTTRPADEPMRTQTAHNETGVAWWPFVVPMRGGGDKERARGVDQALHTVTAGGNHHGLALPESLIDVPAMIVRNNSSEGDGAEMRTPVTEPTRTMTTKGHQSLVTWEHQLLVPYYGNGYARPVTDPMGTQPTRDRWSLAFDVTADIDLDDVRFRMLEPHEIQKAMAFPDDYIICGSAKRDRVRQLGNAVTPPVAELIVSALVEAITSENLDVAA